jgi:hypothetical protein
MNYRQPDTHIAERFTQRSPPDSKNLSGPPAGGNGKIRFGTHPEFARVGKLFLRLVPAILSPAFPGPRFARELSAQAPLNLAPFPIFVRGDERYGLTGAAHPSRPSHAVRKELL